MALQSMTIGSQFIIDLTMIIFRESLLGDFTLFWDLNDTNELVLSSVRINTWLNAFEPFLK